jgi:hypothetical protein
MFVYLEDDMPAGQLVRYGQKGEEQAHHLKSGGFGAKMTALPVLGHIQEVVRPEEPAGEPKLTVIIEADGGHSPLHGAPDGHP